jgi:predicted DNA-binding protein
MGKKLDPISIRLDAEVKAECERLAKDDGRSLSNYVNNVLRLHVEAKKKPEGKRQ